MLSGKESACQCKRHGFNPELARLEKEMATHSIILAWEIPWTETIVHGVTKESDIT